MKKEKSLVVFMGSKILVSGDFVGLPISMIKTILKDICIIEDINMDVDIDVNETAHAIFSAASTYRFFRPMRIWKRGINEQLYKIEQLNN